VTDGTAEDPGLKFLQTSLGATSQPTPAHVSGELIRWKRNDRIREARSDQERKHQMV